MRWTSASPPDAATAAQVAAGFIARVLRAAVSRRGTATLALSGGRTPAAMVDDLAGSGVDWRRVGVWQVDERVAPDGDPARNAGLLAPLADAGARLHLMPVTAGDRGGGPPSTASLPAQLDLVHLGLGDDGHTASWPPGTDVAEQPGLVAWCPEYAGRERLTLTAAAVNAARRRLVLAPARRRRPRWKVGCWATWRCRSSTFAAPARSSWWTAAAAARAGVAG
ncbi:MAG: 6-phosphogluconolactonase [Ilumatobacteraceae bacterium]